MMVQQPWGLSLITVVYGAVALTLTVSNVLWHWAGWELVMIGALCFVITNALTVLRTKPSFAVLIGFYGGIIAAMMPPTVLGIIEPLPYVNAGFLGCVVGYASGKALSPFRASTKTPKTA